METLTLERSVIRGIVLGKSIICNVRTSPAGLCLPAGSYVLRPPQDNPIYGKVMLIELLAETPTPAAIKISEQIPAPAHNIFKMTAFDHLRAPSAPEYTMPSAIKLTAPSALKLTAPAAPANAPSRADAPAIKFDAPAIKFDAPAMKFDAPAIKFDNPAMGWDTAPAIKFDPAARGPVPSVPLSDRSIPGNSLIVSAGFGDLVDVVQRAGPIKLVVV